MANFQIPFSLQHLLIISLALNASFFLRHLYGNNTETPDQVNATCFSPEPTEPAVDVQEQDSRDRVINLNQGDPTMYERYWRQMGDKITVVIPGWQYTSYFTDPTNMCWFMLPEFKKEILRLHQVVGNAVTEGRHLVVGTGSTQLFQAALFALSPQHASEPISVVSASPFYSSYPLVIDYLNSSMYKWGGDARSFKKDGPYIELVTSPNNPDGFTRGPMVNRSDGILIHDLAYYWPQYTPITSPADDDLMLFTVSKCTGHAGMRLGWALVKDEDVAKKMVNYIGVTSIGVSKDSQHRAAKVLKAVSDSCQEKSKEESVFGYGFHQLASRWKRLREVVSQSGGRFSLPEFSSAPCNFFGKLMEPQPGFAWLKCEAVDDCQALLGSKKVLTRGGTLFGSSSKYVRISLLDRDENFYPLLHRLSTFEDSALDYSTI